MKIITAAVVGLFFYFFLSVGSGKGEEHGQKKKSTAEENGSKKSVLVDPHPGTQHADKPQEGDACERQQGQREVDGFRTTGKAWAVPSRYFRRQL